MGSVKPPTVLVVEDDVLIRNLLVELLRDAGIHVVEAETADDAVPVSDESVELLLTDVKMPGSMDGVALARHARERHPNLKIIMVSGHAAVPHDAADIFFRKPFELTELAQAVGELFKR